MTLANALNELRDESLLAVREHHFRRLSDLYSGRELSQPFYLSGVATMVPWHSRPNPSEAIQQSLEFLAEQVTAAADRDCFRPLIVECDIYGVHFIDKLFGAEVFELDGMWQGSYLDQPIGQLEPPDLEHDPTWTMARNLAEAFVEYGLPLPLFSLPTVASALNIGINLFGGELLEVMLTDPEAAQHDLRVINDVLLTIHRWYQTNLPVDQLQPVVGAVRCQPRGLGQLCGCSTQLISSRQYQQFIAALDEELLGCYPHGGMIHLCGSHLQHLATWREMPQLRALQLNDRAAADLEAYHQGLRPDQVCYIEVCDEMPPDEILRLTDGKRVVLAGNVVAAIRASH